MRVITPRSNGTFAFKNYVKSDWYHMTYTPSAGELAPICYPVSWTRILDLGIESNKTLIKDYIRIMTKNGADATMVMVNSRDGSKHRMPQLGETIDETYESYTMAFDSLEEKYQPQIYLVGHSFGGVIDRGILANPSGADLFVNTFTLTQRSRANYRRDRVVLVQTLSAPHHGTHMGDVAGDVADLVNSQAMYNTIYSALNIYANLSWKNYSDAWVRGETTRTVEKLLDSVSGRRDCLQDLLHMNEYNQGILNTTTMKRRDGDNNLVPIYTAAGRNPGGMVYEKSR